MKRRIDSKYEIVVDERYIADGSAKINIRNVYNGNEIPEDEPLFIFRAKDKYALAALNAYHSVCMREGCTKEQIAGIREMISLFDKFRINNPDKMKQPGSTMPEDMKKSISPLRTKKIEFRSSE